MSHFLANPTAHRGACPAGGGGEDTPGGGGEGLPTAHHALPAAPHLVPAQLARPSSHEGSWGFEEALEGIHREADAGSLPPATFTSEKTPLVPVSRAQFLAGMHRHGNAWHCQGPH